MAFEGGHSSGDRHGREADGTDGFTFDVIVNGTPRLYNVPVVCTDRVIRAADEEVSLDSVFWVSRRAGLVLLFARTRSLAFLGHSGDLEEFARTIEQKTDQSRQRTLLQPLAAEVVVCTAGTAVNGMLSGSDLSGLHLAVFTQRAVHLFAEDRHHTVPWPVDQVSEISSDTREEGRAGLRLSAPDVALEFYYLFPEEIQAIAIVARKAPVSVGTEDESIEMFSKGDVSPPRPAELPEFMISVETLQAAFQEAAQRVRVDTSLGDRLDRPYFERHFQDLGEIALGPLLLRRSAALGAGSMAHAIQALDAEQMREDAIAAFHSLIEQLFKVYRGEIEALLLEKRLSSEIGSKFHAVDQHAALVTSVTQRIEMLDSAFGKVLARQHLLLQRLHAREHEPPETEETGLEEATSDWKAQVVKLDVTYGTAWSAVLKEVADLWSDYFIPSLRELAARPRQRLSKNARLAILVITVLSLVGALAFWLS